ncbi:MAG: alpha-galactosidase [Kiritimatiellaeota bacterium]|nr:alpha-galactosidase [Kiritimatiellota bacterium]
MTDIITTILTETPAGTTQFCRREGQFWLARLCGLPTGRQGEATGPARTQGMALIEVDGRRYEGNDLALESNEETEHALLCRWRVGDKSLRLITAWQGCPDTGIVRRSDTLTNTGKTPVTLSRCLARVSFPPGLYECYAQSSRWCHENQGAWQTLHTGVTLRHAWGRTTEESTPYLALRAVGADQGLAFHVLPRGNWTIRVSPVTEGGDLPYAVVELGLADENLHWVLRPGESFVLPEILIQPLPQGEPHLGAPALHRYLLTNYFAGAKLEAPVVYNTWFDQFEILDVPRLRTQLTAAKKVGCEVFVIDAGWYGTGGPNWSAQTGDWREKTEMAFCGNMRAFADEVRAAGLGFGLWMEPERFGPEAPIRAEHPKWFVPVGIAARLDLTLPDAYAYLRSEIERLVEIYQLAWMKIDFNFILDADAAGAELSEYTTAWYRLLDEIRAAYPETFFEGCASGALRGDLATLTHVDGHFLSDTVNPVDVLRISQGAWLRLPPGRLARWVVIRSAGQVVPRYGSALAASPTTVLTPCGALWEPAVTTDLDFALLAAMPGILGFSGDLASLPPEQCEKVAQGIAFFKRWRRFLTGAAAHLLTPPETLDRREGWIGVQLQVPGDDTSLVFVYRLGVCGSPPPFRLQALNPDTRYGVCPGTKEGDTGIELTGAELMRDGLPLRQSWPAGKGAEVFCVRTKRG